MQVSSMGKLVVNVTTKLFWVGVSRSSYDVRSFGRNMRARRVYSYPLYAICKTVWRGCTEPASRCRLKTLMLDSITKFFATALVVRIVGGRDKFG